MAGADWPAAVLMHAMCQLGQPLCSPHPSVPDGAVLWCQSRVAYERCQRAGRSLATWEIDGRRVNANSRGVWRDGHAIVLALGNTSIRNTCRVLSSRLCGAPSHV